MKVLAIGTYGWTEASPKAQALTGERHWIHSGTDVQVIHVISVWRSYKRVLVQANTGGRTLYAWVDSGDVVTE